MILTEEDFDIPPYNIPNLQKVKNTFESYKNLKEEEVLRFLLGDDLYEGLKAGLTDNGTPREEADIEQRWKDLRDGVSYNHLGRSYRYAGLKTLLIPYMYSQWIEDHWQSLSGIGVITPKAENATVKLPLKNVMNAWNEFCFLAGTPIGRFGSHYYRRYGVYIGTLYGYLRSTDVYDDVLYEMDINTYMSAFTRLPEFRTWL